MKDEEPVKITIMDDGPMIIKGVFTIIGSSGEPLVFSPSEMEAGVALCACGKSQAMPLCDGSHIKKQKF